MRRLGELPPTFLLLRVMKAERCEELLADAVWDESLLDQISGTFFEMLLRYILNADIDSNGFERRIKAISNSSLRDSAMTLAQRLTQKGLEKGRQEGRQEGLQDAILETLAIRFGSTPECLVAAIRHVEDENRLKELHQASIRAGTMDEFARRI